MLDFHLNFDSIEETKQVGKYYKWKYIFYPNTMVYMGIVECPREAPEYFLWSSPASFLMTTPKKVKVFAPDAIAIANSVVDTDSFDSYCALLDWLQENQESMPYNITARLDYCFNVIKNGGVYNGR